MKDRRDTLIKHIALIAKVVGILPVIIIISYTFRRIYYFEQFWFQLAGLLGAGYLGYCLMKLKTAAEKRLKDKPGIIKLILTVSYLLSVIFLLLLSDYILGYDGLMRFSFFIMSTAVFFSFIKDYRLHYSYILTLERIAFITGIYIVAMIISKADILGLLYIFIIGSYIFIGSQLKVEELLERTQENTPLFGNIKKENGRWVCLLMSFIFIGYPFRNLIVQGIKWMAMKILWLVISVVIFLINLLPVSESSETRTEVMPGMGELPGAETSELLNFILWILAAGLIGFILYKYRESIYTAVKEKIAWLKTIINKLYSFLFGKGQDKDREEAYYEEHVEEIGSETIKRYHKQDITKRSWKREVKKYIKQSSGTHRVREGYKLILQGVKLQKIEIKKADTPREIEEQVERQLNKLPLSGVTLTYEQIRYGETEEEAKHLNQIKEILKQLLEINK